MVTIMINALISDILIIINDYTMMYVANNDLFS